MKRFLLVLVSLLAIIPFYGYDFESDGLCYRIIDDTSVEVAPLNLNSSNGCGYTELGDVIIPDSVSYNAKSYIVTQIGQDAFYKCESLTSITFPNTLIKIQSNAFNYCNKLTHIDLPKSLTYIGYGAFQNCYGLTELVIPENIKEMHYAFTNDTHIKTIYYYPEDIQAFSHSFPIYVEQFIFGDNVRQIPHDCCLDMKELKSITIPRSVTKIDSEAFRGCIGIKHLTWNAIQDVNIGLWALPQSSNIEQLTIGKDVQYIPARLAAHSKIASIVFPSSLKAIPQGAFMECVNLTSLHIPASVGTINDDAFLGCTSIATITVDASNHTFDSRDNCNAIIRSETNSLVLGCNNSTIPSTIKEISNNAFYGCTEITKIELPNSLTSIGSEAFCGCTGLTQINLPNSLKSIGSGAFYECAGLTQISLPDSLTSIGSYAFVRCSGLTEISFPKTLTSIGEQAFLECKKLAKITALPNFPPAIYSGQNHTFNQVNKSIPLYVPYGATNRYKLADGWSSFNNIIEIKHSNEPLNQYDVNCDGKVDIADVNDVINALLSTF